MNHIPFFLWYALWRSQDGPFDWLFGCLGIMAYQPLEVIQCQILFYRLFNAKCLYVYTSKIFNKQDFICLHMTWAFRFFFEIKGLWHGIQATNFSLFNLWGTVFLEISKSYIIPPLDFTLDHIELNYCLLDTTYFTYAEVNFIWVISLHDRKLTAPNRTA